MLRGHFPIDEQRLFVGRSGEARPWRVIKDPSELFFKTSRFRISDLNAGGFEHGTIFENEQTGEQRIADVAGVVRRVRATKAKRRVRRKPILVKAVVRRVRVPKSKRRVRRRPILVKAVKRNYGGGTRSHAVH